MGNSVAGRFDPQRNSGGGGELIFPLQGCEGKNFLRKTQKTVARSCYHAQNKNLGRSMYSARSGDDG